MSENDFIHIRKNGLEKLSGAAPEHEHSHQHEEDAGEDLTVREHPLDLTTVREKLKGKSGKQYWRTLEELSEDPHFEDLLHREFPRQASEWDEAVDRRDFLKLAAASLAFAGMTGCGSAPPQLLVPYVTQPDGMVLGKPLFFATAMPCGTDAIGLIVTSHEGRPTHVSGNPDHPSSLGGTDVISQASVLNLYDPDRAQTVTNMGDIKTWEQFQVAAQAIAQKAAGQNGSGFRILTGTITSPTIAAQIEKILAQIPGAKWHQWEPAASSGAYEGSKLAFGRYVNTIYHPEKADVILSLDADFMAAGPGHVAYMNSYFRRRKLNSPSDTMSRLYVVEPTPTVTGATADHRLPLKASEVEQFARALAALVGLGGSGALAPTAQKWLDAVASELQKHHGTSLVVAGEFQPPAVHALAHAINAALGNVGTTVHYTEPVEAGPVNQLESFTELCDDMNAGKVQTLIMFGSNPVYDAPHNYDFVSKLKNVPLCIRLSSHFDETAQYCHWHIAESHFLESWGDARAFDGTYSVIQPLIAPLYHSHSAFELLAAFTNNPAESAYDAVRARVNGFAGSANTEEFWRKTLNDGVLAGTALPPVTITTKFNPASLPAARTPLAGELEFIFRPDPNTYDGRYANNGWLQELPRPVTKLTWDNAAHMSPKLAQTLGLTQVVQSRGGEHGQILTNVIDISLSNSKVTAAAWIVPGQADDVVLLPLGYGRTHAGYTGSNKGFNAYEVRTSEAQWVTTAGAESIKRTGDSYPLACTQYHFNMEGRKIMTAGTLEEYRKNPSFALENENQPPNSDTLYDAFSYPYYAWGMAIDLNSCNGCNACVVACQSENNIAVVGKDQVMRAREMHWIRIDRWYLAETPSNDASTNEGDQLYNPPTFFQPVPCQQCENAPCEQVCPVGATVHSAEGLNDMVYNRCIGTRYCSNNCPYKVRRFNFLRFQDWETPSLKLLRNPEVTVRSRGVMEKCTYCVQRINHGRINAEKEDRKIQDGEIVTACESACPSHAIVFGNINDPNSRVSKLKAQTRNYTLLGELNSRPRTTYLAAVRNPNPELPDAAQPKENA
ncbi:MAG TPA: TAT-variant-translocated molybdopterin oxidoreductase [Candidatus Acidoferrum sp.]|nr:TAT-variant-translocated molybdopterin oxidoreductase [Candidatus Acidoferrum sp.]